MPRPAARPRHQCSAREGAITCAAVPFNFRAVCSLLARRMGRRSASEPAADLSDVSCQTVDEGLHIEIGGTLTFCHSVSDEVSVYVRHGRSAFRRDGVEGCRVALRRATSLGGLVVAQRLCGWVARVVASSRAKVVPAAGEVVQVPFGRTDGVGGVGRQGGGDCLLLGQEVAAAQGVWQGVGKAAKGAVASPKEGDGAVEGPSANVCSTAHSPRRSSADCSGESATVWTVVRSLARLILT